MTNNEERIAVLLKLGYTERQAAFLCLAALHGGYFLRRQCGTFLGLGSGGTTERLITKAVEKGHVRVHPSANQTLIYHVGKKSFFEILGEEDNCNRRWRPPYSVKLKLMGLDYVLAHPRHHYLATEQEKLDYFSGRLALPSQILPARFYRSRGGRITATRYFPDKFPLFLSGAPDASAPVVGFCFIDGNIGKPSGLGTYLGQYRELWNRLPNVEVIYVSADRHMFPKARGIFGRMFPGGMPTTSKVEKGERTRLVAHFRMRGLLERRETSSFSPRMLDQLREELEEFSGLEYAALYTRWKAEGDQVVTMTPGDGERNNRCTFSTFELGHDYQLLGELARVG